MQAPVQTGRAIAYSAALCFFSLPIGWYFINSGLSSTGADMDYYLVVLNLFVAQDMWTGPLMAGIILFAWYVSGRTCSLALPDAGWAVPGLALASALAVVLLRFVAHRNYNLSLDEYLPEFQAQIFRSGDFAARIPADLFDMHLRLQPFFTYVDTDHQMWLQHYRPVHAAILSLFPAGWDTALAHALLTAITVLAMASIARRLFPEHREAPLLAALLLVASPQVLITAASGFSFTAHLAFNTVWLALFLRGSWRAHVLAAILGFFAVGLHQVHVHLLFAFPVGVAMLWGMFGNRLKAIPYLVAYALAVPLWVTWPEIAIWLQTGDASVLPRSLTEVEYIANFLNYKGSVGAADRILSLVFLYTNLWRMVVWLSPALLIVLCLALLPGRRMIPFARLSAAAFVFSLVLSHLLLSNPMHSWGSRYYHPALVYLLIVALGAFYARAGNPGFDRLRSAVLITLVTGAVALVPLRAWQVYEKVAPRARIQTQIEAIDADAVNLLSDGYWFAGDFLRNDPYLRNRPHIFVNLRLAEGENAPGAASTVTVDVHDLLDWGLPRGTWLEPAYPISSPTD